MSSQKKRILILCTGNSARSQMAEGILRAAFGDELEVFSAGTHPGEVRPEAIAVLAEVGIDISLQRSKSVDEVAGREIDFVLTVCDNARENCPYFPAGTRLIHRAFEDPADVEGSEQERLAVFRKVRNEIVVFIGNELRSIIETS